MMVNASSPVKDAAIEFVTYMYDKDNYRRMVEGCEDVIFAMPSAARQEYLDSLHWLKPGFFGVNYVTPFDIVGDFVYNFNEFGQIVITNFADALNGVKSVEEAMAVAQRQAEAAGRTHRLRFARGLSNLIVKLDRPLGYSCRLPVRLPDGLVDGQPAFPCWTALSKANIDQKATWTE